MLKAGSSFDEALDMSKKSVGNAYVESLLEAARLNIINGSDPVKELDNLGIFPVLFMKMLKIGNMTGELESSLSKISVIYDKEVEKSLSKITTMIEPALVTILSLIIGVMLFTVMLPLINIIAAIG
jgi:type IV pilus assembly protein PilC